MHDQEVLRVQLLCWACTGLLKCLQLEDQVKKWVPEVDDSRMYNLRDDITSFGVVVDRRALPFASNAL